LLVATDEQKRLLMKKVTDVVAETTGAPVNHVSVHIDEMPLDHVSRDHVVASDERK
jgi:4-oxalocrotonate tautomerase